MNKTLDEIKASLDLGKMSSYELVESALAAIDSKTGEGQKAFVKVYRDEARAQAIAIDKLRASGVDLSAIAGIPISVKDLFDVRGEITMAGSRVRKNRSPATREC